MSRVLKKKRQRVNIWLSWKFEEGLMTITLTYWRAIQYSAFVRTDTPSDWARVCWEAEAKALAWAYRRGFRVVRERLKAKGRG